MDLHSRRCGPRSSYRALAVRPWKWGVPVPVHQVLVTAVGLLGLTLYPVGFGTALFWTPLVGFGVFQAAGWLYRGDPWGPDLWAEDVTSGRREAVPSRSSLGTSERPWERPGVGR